MQAVPLHRAFGTNPSATDLPGLVSGGHFSAPRGREARTAFLSLGRRVAGVPEDRIAALESLSPQTRKLRLRIWLNSVDAGACNAWPAQERTGQLRWRGSSATTVQGTRARPHKDRNPQKERPPLPHRQRLASAGVRVNCHMHVHVRVPVGAPIGIQILDIDIGGLLIYMCV